MSKTEVMGRAVNGTMELLARGKAATGLLLWGCPLSFVATVIGIWIGELDREKVDLLGEALDSFFPYFISAVLPVAVGMVGPEIAGKVAEALANLRRKK